MSEDERVEVVARALDPKWPNRPNPVGVETAARAVLAALDDPTGEGREVQGEHLREWSELGIPTRCCFWCTLNDVNARLRALLTREEAQG